MRNGVRSARSRTRSGRSIARSGCTARRGRAPRPDRAQPSARRARGRVVVRASSPARSRAVATAHRRALRRRGSSCRDACRARRASRATTAAPPPRSIARLTAASSSIAGGSPTPTVCRAEVSRRTKSWKVPPMRRRQPAMSRSTRSVPSTRTRPDVGRYMPASSFTRVVFPAPFSPTMATVDPAGSNTSMSCNTGVVVPG